MAWHYKNAAPLLYMGDWPVKIIILRIVTSLLLAAIGWTDYKTMEIPDFLNFALGICAFAALFIAPEMPILERYIGAFCISAPMYLLCLVIEDAFGEGDIILVSVMGFYLGWRALLAGVFLGFLVGGIQAVYLLGSKRAAPGSHAHMAFGPALCFGLFIAQFYGMDIFRWYQDFFYL